MHTAVAIMDLYGESKKLESMQVRKSESYLLIVNSICAIFSYNCMELIFSLTCKVFPFDFTPQVRSDVTPPVTGKQANEADSSLERNSLSDSQRLTLDRSNSHTNRDSSSLSTSSERDKVFGAREFATAGRHFL